MVLTLNKAGLMLVLLTVGCENSRCARLSALSRTSPNCLKFVQYLPSTWESEWLEKASARQNVICKTLNSEGEQSNVWLSGIGQAAEQESGLDQASIENGNKVWSLYKYQDMCSVKRKLVFVPIEPAVGLLRNPHAAPCNNGKLALDVQDRNFLAVAPTILADDYPGRKLLFDLGTGQSFQSSLLWFVESYATRGIEFDDIWSWEAEETGSHQYWQTVPAEHVHKLHFYNTYASDESGPAAPLGIIERHFRPGDFVVVKLDIDNEVLESSIMKKILDIRHMIGELYFEKHFDAPEMRPYFGELNTTYQETLTLFNEYRKLGIRLHYWP